MVDLSREPAKLAALHMRRLAVSIEDEADNISPVNNVHPAPMMRRWAKRLDAIAKTLEASS